LGGYETGSERQGSQRVTKHGLRERQSKW
jgi:hypothetical protein